MKVRNIIAAVMAVPVIFGCAGAYPAAAKVLEPEIVKTETWTTSYYIDDDIDTLYPYVDCQADIYNDGTLKVSFWNTHEWDGFLTYADSHKVTIINYCPDNMAASFIKQETFDYCFPISQSQYNDKYTLSIKLEDADYSFWIESNDKDISYFPTDYTYSFSSDNIFNEIKTLKYYYYRTGKKISNTNSYMYIGTLPEFPILEKSIITFSPTVKPESNYDFHILGHDITITPEILASEPISKQETTTEPTTEPTAEPTTSSTPDISDLEKQIRELKEKNAALEKEVASLKALSDPDNVLRLDANGDGIIDSNDASIILTIYAINSTGGNVSKISELPGGEE